MRWYKVYADGSEIDIICAYSGEEAIEIAIMRHGKGATYSVRGY